MKYVPLLIVCLFLVLTAGAIVAIANCADCSSGSPPVTGYTFTTTEIARVPACTESFPELPIIAARLNIAPYYGGKPSAFVLVMCDGRKYDFIELLNAALERLDQKGNR